MGKEIKRRRGRPRKQTTTKDKIHDFGLLGKWSENTLRHVKEEVIFGFAGYGSIPEDKDLPTQYEIKIIEDEYKTKNEKILKVFEEIHILVTPKMWQRKIKVSESYESFSRKIEAYNKLKELEKDYMKYKEVINK